MSNRIDNLSQNVTNANNPPFSAPYAVSGRAEPTPDKVPHCLYSDGCGSTLAGPAAALAPSGVDSLTRVSFESLIDRVRELELHFGYLPDRYLQSLRGQIISSRDHFVMMSGDSIIDSIRSHRLRVCDPVSPTSGSSRDGDSIVPFLQSLFGIATFNSSSRPVPSTVSPLVSGATFMRGCSSVGTGWVTPSVPSTVPTPIASESLLGRPSVASGVASSFACAVPSGVASVVRPAVASSFSAGSEGCVSRLPAFPATTFAPSASAPLSFSVASLLAPSSSSVLPSAPLTSSQPVGPSVLVSLGCGGAMVGGGGGSGYYRDAGVYSDLLNIPEGEESDTRVHSEATGAFRQVL